MFKIKDNIDLKELEKFGYVEGAFGTYKLIKCNTKKKRVYISVNTSRCIHKRKIIPFVKGYSFGEEMQVCKKDIEDLIQAGLVEKV